MMHENVGDLRCLVSLLERKRLDMVAADGRVAVFVIARKLRSEVCARIFAEVFLYKIIRNVWSRK